VYKPYNSKPKTTRLASANRSTFVWTWLG